MYIPADKRFKLFLFVFLFAFSAKGQNCLVINSSGYSQTASIGDTVTFEIEMSEADTSFNVTSVHVQLKKSSQVMDEVIILFDESPFSVSFEIPCLSSANDGNYYFLLTPKCDTDCNCDDDPSSSGIYPLDIVDADEFAIQTNPPNAWAIDCDVSSIDLSISHQGSPITWNTGSNGGNTVATVGGQYIAWIDLVDGCLVQEELEIHDLQGDVTAEFDETGFPIVDCVDTFRIDLTPVTDPPSNGPFAYNWEGPGEIENDNAEDPLINGLTEGVYTVTITDLGTGCSGTATFNAKIETEPPTATIEAALSTITCIDNIITLDGSMSTGSSSGITYLWSTPNGNLISNSDESIVQIDDGGIYKLTVSNQVGEECTHDTLILIGEDLMQPFLDIEGDLSFCAGASTTLIASNLEPDIDVEFEWIANGSTGNSIEIDTEGDYAIIATNILNGCTAEETVFVEEGSGAPLNLSTYNYSLASGETLSIPIPDDISWTIVESNNVDDMSTSTADNFEISANLQEVRAAGTIIYDITLADSGCQNNSAEITVNVFPNDTEIFIPELISPNGDGMNDTWNILFPNPADAANYQLKIFNRSGGLVHESPDMTIPWSANNCADGTYYYVIEGDGVLKKGAVTIIRQ